jgi:hypothetical protein
MSIEVNEQGVSRKHTYFCLDRDRHSHWASKVIEVVPKQITVFGEEINGWIVTTEETVIDATITLRESLERITSRDPE